MTRAKTQYFTLEGKVMRIPEGGKALFFRETGASHDLCIPLSQISDAAIVMPGDTEIEITAWLFRRLRDEGKL